jgi:hypothetical protein
VRGDICASNLYAVFIMVALESINIHKQHQFSWRCLAIMVYRLHYLRERIYAQFVT